MGLIERQETGELIEPTPRSLSCRTKMMQRHLGIFFVVCLACLRGHFTVRLQLEEQIAAIPAVVSSRACLGKFRLLPSCKASAGRPRANSASRQPGGVRRVVCKGPGTERHQHETVQRSA